MAMSAKVSTLSVRARLASRVVGDCSVAVARLVPRGDRLWLVDGDARLPGRTVHTLAGEAVRLTSRQANLLDGLLAGESNRQIAERLCLSEGTVKNHVSTLLLTFGVRSRAQLISALR